MARILNLAEALLLLMIITCSIRVHTSEAEVLELDREGVQLMKIFDFVWQYREERVNELFNSTLTTPYLLTPNLPYYISNVTFTKPIKIPKNFFESPVAEIICRFQHHFIINFKGLNVSSEGVIKYTENDVTHDLDFSISFKLKTSLMIQQKPFFSAYFECEDKVKVVFELKGLHPEINTTTLIKAAVDEACIMMIITLKHYHINYKGMILANDCLEKMEENHLYLKTETASHTTFKIAGLSMENAEKMRILYETKAYATTFQLWFENATIQHGDEDDAQILKNVSIGMKAALHEPFSTLTFELRLNDQNKHLYITELEDNFLHGIKTFIAKNILNKQRSTSSTIPPTSSTIPPTSSTMPSILSSPVNQTVPNYWMWISVILILLILAYFLFFFGVPVILNEFRQERRSNNFELVQRGVNPNNFIPTMRQIEDYINERGTARDIHFMNQCRRSLDRLIAENRRRE